MDLNGLKDKLLSALGQASEGAKDFAGKAADATKDFAEKAADKAKSATRIAKLNIEISQEKENMKKTYLEIGKLYYDTHKDDPDGFFIQLCDEIAAAEKAIAEKEAEIADLKDKEPDVDVEFEEIVEQEEAAAEECCDAAEEICKSAPETVCECAEEVKEAVCECVPEEVCECAEKAEEAAEACCSEVEREFRSLQSEFQSIENDLRGAAEEIVEKIGETEE